MQRRKFINTLSATSGILIAPSLLTSKAKTITAVSAEVTSVLPGIWKFTIGKPEKITPQSTRNIQPSVDNLKKLPEAGPCPIKLLGAVSDRGTIIRMPVGKDEYMYGLGLQFQSFQQRGLKKMLRVNADPIIDSGDSHAPVPFFVTTRGYGVFVDTARYSTFYMGNKKKKPGKDNQKEIKTGDKNGWNALNGPYERLGLGVESDIWIEIPRSPGVDIYVFAGPSMLQAVQRYNLFAGGGALPPRWGLGFWYRVQSDFSQEEVIKMGQYFRNNKIPCDVLGLEPHWQTHAYSCSYKWSDLFPNPAQMVSDLKNEHFRLNLWEHAFVHPSSPLYNSLIPHSGDYEVWDGLVPDFITEKGRTVFAGFHRKTHVDLGVSGYKADECDNSDFTGNWSFPELSRFPSGADGEQMHSLFGLRYQDALLEAFKGQDQRTYGLVRSSGALAAPYPFVLYSDLYTHKQYIHAVAQSGFSGLLWTPEVRDARSNDDLIRRLQSVVFSPLAMVDAWYLKNAPWKQIETKANNEGRFAENWEKLEAQCREIIELRMKLIPYIHSAFVKYNQEGVPPFRALVMDYPNDPAVRKISDQFLVGENMLVAPLTESEKTRKIYLPEGDWYYLWNSKKYTGKSEYSMDVPVNEIPVFIKSGTILPLAKVTLHTDDPESWKLSMLIFGDNIRPATLYEENGTVSPNLSEVKLLWDSVAKKVQIERKDNAHPHHYSVDDWKLIS